MFKKIKNTLRKDTRKSNETPEIRFTIKKQTINLLKYGIKLILIYYTFRGFYNLNNIN